MPKTTNMKLSVWEKIGYSLGDGAANIAWRGVSIFLFIFYVDVFGLDPAAVGLLLLVARFGDGVSDVAMGVIGDRTNTKHGKFRPWVLWSAIPLGVSLSLLFTTPDFSPTGKLIYAYVTYILFTLVYTANNIPYGALMAVMTGDDKERTSLGSFRLAGAFAGGMVVQSALLFLVMHFGNINPTIDVTPMEDARFKVVVTAPQSVKNVRISTKDEVALFSTPENEAATDDDKKELDTGWSFSTAKGEPHTFIVSNIDALAPQDIRIIDQKRGYSYAIYLMSGIMALFMIITFFATKERVAPPPSQKTHLSRDLKDLITNRPWVILLIMGLVFCIYGAIKMSVTVMYFKYFLHNELLAATYMAMLMGISIAGAAATSPLGKWLGKRNLFIYALLLTGALNSLIFFCGPEDIHAIFVLGIGSEFFSAILPTLFFAMLGDAADYSEFVNGRRATGLVYSAGSFSTKVGGGIGAAITGWVLAAFAYDGANPQAIQGAIPGIVWLMSWIPMVVALLGAAIMLLYPLNQTKMTEITQELARRRSTAENA